MTSHAGVPVEMAVAYDEARAFVSIETVRDTIWQRICKITILEVEEFVSSPIWIVCPGSVAKISAQPIAVQNVAKIVCGRIDHVIHNANNVVESNSQTAAEIDYAAMIDRKST